MRKFEKIGYGIEVNLPGLDYIVRANILRIDAENNTYNISLELRRVDIGKWDMLDQKHYSITSDNINMAVYEFIMNKFINGFFEKFITNYEYELVCFERGNELFELERLGGE